VEAKVESHTKLVDFRSPFLDQLPKPFDGMDMELPAVDAKALTQMIQDFQDEHGRTPRVCEVGSWAGRSAIIMAQAGARVTCVDTWEGSQNDDGCKAYDGSRGRPLDVFRRNTAGLPIAAHVGKSPEAAGDFADGEFDIVYLDAEHDYESVKADIEAWLPKARHIIAGHDYHSFPGVRKAVEASLPGCSVMGNVWTSKVPVHVSN
jgi:hypothetical protein